MLRPPFLKKYGDANAYWNKNPELAGSDLRLFRNFVWLVWHALPDIQKDPTEIQIDVADFMQFGPDWSICFGHRGLGKSYLLASFVVWRWLINADLRVMVVSASEGKAADFAVLVRQLIELLPICHHLRPRKDQRNSTFKFDVGPASPAKDASLVSLGVGSQLTGGRSDLLCIDDPEVPGNAASQKQKTVLLTKLQEAFAIGKSQQVAAGSQIKILGTPQTCESVYYQLENQGFTIACWPARYPKDIDTYKGRLAPFITDALEKNPKLAGTPTNPKMNDEADLLKREQGKQAWFRLQYQLDPSMSDAERYPLRLRDFIVAHADPEQGPVYLAWAADQRYQITDADVPNVGFSSDRWYRSFTDLSKVTHEKWASKILVIDPAGGQDQTAFVVLYFLHGFIWVVESGAVSGFGKEALETLANVAKRHSVNTCVIERNFGAGMFKELFAPVVGRIHACALEDFQSSGMKEKRICDAIELMLGTHRLVVTENVIKKDFAEPDPDLQLLYQLTHITRDKGALVHDDKLDCLAIGIAWFQGLLDQDVARTEATLSEQRREEELERFLRKADSQRQPRADVGGLLKPVADLEYASGGLSSDGFEDDSPWWDDD